MRWHWYVDPVRGFVHEECDCEGRCVRKSSPRTLPRRIDRDWSRGKPRSIGQLAVRTQPDPLYQQPLLERVAYNERQAREARNNLERSLAPFSRMVIPEHEEVAHHSLPVIEYDDECEQEDETEQDEMIAFYLPFRP